MYSQHYIRISFLRIKIFYRRLLSSRSLLSKKTNCGQTFLFLQFCQITRQVRYAQAHPQVGGLCPHHPSGWPTVTTPCLRVGELCPSPAQGGSAGRTILHSSYAPAVCHARVETKMKFWIFAKSKNFTKFRDISLHIFAKILVFQTFSRKCSRTFSFRKHFRENKKIS
jgi:hypothetical protein